MITHEYAHSPPPRDAEYTAGFHPFIYYLDWYEEDDFFGEYLAEVM